MGNEKWQQVLDVAHFKLEKQITACDSVDQKIGMCMGFIGVMIAIAIGVKISTLFSHFLYILGNCIMAISMALLYFGYKPVNLATGLKINKIVKLIKDEENNEKGLKTQIGLLHKAIEHNNKILKRKSICLKRGSGLLLIGVIIYTIYMISKKINI